MSKSWQEQLDEENRRIAEETDAQKKDPLFEQVTKEMGIIIKAIYGTNPYEGGTTHTD